MNNVKTSRAGRGRFIGVRWLVLGSMVAVGGLLAAVEPESEPEATVESEDYVPGIDILDMNGDGVLDPYEAMDALLVIQDELDGEPVTVEALIELEAAWEQDAMEDIDRIISELDENDDGRISRREADSDLRDYWRELDLNRDRLLTRAELIEAHDFEPPYMTREEIEEEVDDLFSSMDKNGDDIISRKEARRNWGYVKESDANRDRQVTRQEVMDAYVADNMDVEFEIQGDTALMRGNITADTPGEMLRLIFEHPEVRKIDLVYVPGSLDDESGMRAIRYARAHGFDTFIKAGGMVASGGTDFFLAGVNRTCEPGGLVGVHSWSWMGDDGNELPRDHEEHQAYLEFYRDMGIGEDFYWFTLDSAGADDIHWMSQEELRNYNCVTSPTPKP
ncbi:MAG: hypothetical protein MK116_07205 [Phycisphaerales bacterium]|nr:hypothetical protein [Phycisphaerales bacterium]